jgi:hypothetical protein
MVRHRLVRCIEAHSDDLAGGLLTRVQASAQLPSFNKKVPPAELKQRVYEIYRHLGQWLMKRGDADIERRYREIGARRCHQGVPLSELIRAIILTKENLWDFLNRESCPGFEIEVLAEHDMFRMIDQFFNRAIHYAAIGFEEAAAAQLLAKDNAAYAGAISRAADVRVRPS